MTPNLTRRRFLVDTTTGLLVISTPFAVSAQTIAPQQSVPKRPDPLSAAMVSEFACKPHGDLS